MIKRAGKLDTGKIFEFLQNEGSINTVILAYLEKYGLEKDFLEVWLYFNENETSVLAVIMRYFNSLYIYSGGCISDTEEIGSFISFIGADIISGKLDILSDIALHLENMVLEPYCHMVLGDGSRLECCGEVQRVTLDDCRELSFLIYSVPEFARFYHSRLEIEQGMRKRLELGICRYFVIRTDGKIVSQAYTTTESSQYATIGGVVTLKEYRNRGFASKIVSGICKDILRDHKIPNLFYNNKEAGRVYKHLGFSEAGEYAMLLSEKYR